MTITILDLTGLKCPLPALLTRKAMARLRPGECLEVHCTDPMAIIDIPAMVVQAGDELAGTERREEVLVFLIEKRNEAICNCD